MKSSSRDQGRTADVGRLRSIRVRSAIGRSGWFAVIRRDASG